MNTISRFVGWLVRLLNTPLWCAHDWRLQSIEEVTERYEYHFQYRCRKCGKTCSEYRP